MARRCRPKPLTQRMPSEACVVKSSSVSPSRLIVLDAILYGPDAARSSAISLAIWLAGLLQRPPAAAISAFGRADGRRRPSAGRAFGYEPAGRRHSGAIVRLAAELI